MLWYLPHIWKLAFSTDKHIFSASFVHFQCFVHHFNLAPGRTGLCYVTCLIFRSKCSLQTDITSVLVLYSYKVLYTIFIIPQVEQAHAMLPASYLATLILAFSTDRHIFIASFVQLQCFAHHFHLAQVEQAHVMLPASYLETSVIYRQTFLQCKVCTATKFCIPFSSRPR